MKEESVRSNLLTRNVPTLRLIADSSQVGHSYREQECVCLPARMWREGSVLGAGRLWRSNNYSCLDEVKFRQKPMKEASVYEIASTYSLSRGRRWHFTRLRSFVTRHFLVLWHLFCPWDRCFFLSLLSPVFKFLFYSFFFLPTPPLPPSFARWAILFSVSFRPPLYQKPISVTTRNISDTCSPGGRRWSPGKHQGCEAVMNDKVDKDHFPATRWTLTPPSTPQFPPSAPLR